MTPSNRHLDEDAGLSLDELSAALAGKLSSGADPYSAPPAEDRQGAGDQTIVPSDEPIETDIGCEISPRTIFEAMLFVGGADGQALASEQVASLMRGVRAAEIDEIAKELNADYAARGCPYQIVTEGTGYRLTLRDEFARTRDKFYGKLRQARLSQAAIEVLATVAYNEPLTREQVNQLRGSASGQILAQLVRRQLLRLDRSDKSRGGARYFTTPRFLELFGLERLEDLPRSEDLERA